MLRLMLFRHAKTERDAPGGRDEDRRLDERGRRDAADMGRWIAAHPPFADMVMVSPAVRAHQTWDLAWAEAQASMPAPKVAFAPDIYEADVAQLLQVIRSAAAANPQRLMLVGHNPAMHELSIALYANGDPTARDAIERNLPTSGLVAFDFAIDSWNEIGFRRGDLKFFVSPDTLKTASR